VSANDAFLDLMEAYFGRSDEQKAPVARPELAYQVMLIHSVCTDKVCVWGGGGAGGFMGMCYHQAA
jgi:hypothetical protein